MQVDFLPLQKTMDPFPCVLLPHPTSSHYLNRKRRTFVTLDHPVTFLSKPSSPNFPLMSPSKLSGRLSTIDFGVRSSSPDPLFSRLTLSLFPTNLRTRLHCPSSSGPLQPRYPLYQFLVSLSTFLPPPSRSFPLPILVFYFSFITISNCKVRDL